jgi:hypothetical protein
VVSIRSTSDERQGQRPEAPSVSAGGQEERGAASLAGGRLVAEITNRIVALMREHYGRGPIKAKTYVEPDLTIEMFLMDEPLPGFGALELVDPGA